MEMSEEKLLKEAVVLCLDNAEQYHKDAEILVAFRSYGHALALTVLGEEELAKAIIYYLWSEDLLPEHFISYLEKKQYGHIDEQAWAKGLTISYEIIELGEHIREAIEKRERIRTQDFISLPRLFDKKSNVLKFKTLQKNKERGFYVDFNTEKMKFLSPSSLKKDMVERYLSETKNRFEFLKPFLSLSLTPSEKKIIKAQLKDLLDLQ